MINMIVGDYMAKYIGANHIHGTWLGGIDSSFSGVFQDEQVLIGSGLDYTPCIIGDISDIYIYIHQHSCTEHNRQGNR